MTPNFRVGQKVVRINCDRDDGAYYLAGNWSYTFPEIGEVCTVKTINVWPYGTLITLCEHDNSHLIRIMGCQIEPGFYARHFRPVVARKTDISIFERMLDSRKLENVKV